MDTASLRESEMQRSEPWDDWERYVDEGLRRESDGPDRERRVVRSRLIRSWIWFTLAIMPARERWFGWFLDRPHPIVQTHDGPVPAVPHFESSLPSRP